MLMKYQCSPSYPFSAIWMVAVARIAAKRSLEGHICVLNAIITLMGLLFTAYDKGEETLVVWKHLNS